MRCMKEIVRGFYLFNSKYINNVFRTILFYECILSIRLSYFFVTTDS